MIALVKCKILFSSQFEITSVALFWLNERLISIFVLHAQHPSICWIRAPLLFSLMFWYWIDSTSHLHHAIMKVMGVISVIYKGTRNWEENSWETAQSQHNAVTFIKLPLSKNLSVCWNIKCLYCQICPCVPISYIWFFPLFGDWMQWLSFYSRTPSLQSPYNLSLARTQKRIGFLGLWVFPKRSLTNILYMLMWPGFLILQQAVMLCTPVSSIYSKTTA